MLGLWATQPQRGGTTSCASRPSAGIDRVKCLISLKATCEQMLVLSTVGRGGARRPRPGGEVTREMLFRAREGNQRTNNIPELAIHDHVKSTVGHSRPR